MQKVVNNERRVREQLETQVKDLKAQISNKSQTKALEAEVEIMKNKLKLSETEVKETSSLLLSLQAEMAMVKKQHRNALQEVSCYISKLLNLCKAFLKCKYFLLGNLIVSAYNFCFSRSKRRQRL